MFFSLNIDQEECILENKCALEMTIWFEIHDLKYKSLYLYRFLKYFQFLYNINLKEKKKKRKLFCYCLFEPETA